MRTTGDDHRDLDQLLRTFIRDGNVGAMEAIVAGTRPKLLAAARRIGAPQDAEDSVQTAYHSLLRRAVRPLDAPVLPWLLTAVVRIAYRRKAIVQRQNAIAERLAQSADETRRTLTPLHAAATHEEVTLLRREVARLPDKYRDVVVLHHLEGLSIGETARLLCVPSATVKTRLHRARRLLGGRLAPVLAYAIAVIPWGLADIARSGGPLLAQIGGVMKIKTSTVVIAAALIGAVALTSAVVVAVNDAQESESAADEQSAADEARIIRLEGERNEWRRQAEQRARRLDSQRLIHATAQDQLRSEARDADVAAEAFEAEAGGSRAASSTDAGEAELSPDLIDVRDLAAIDGGTTDSAVEWADRAERLLKMATTNSDLTRDQKERVWLKANAAVGQLKLHGADGFRAVTALLRAGRQGTWMRSLVESAFVEGQEETLLGVARDETVPVYSRWNALAALHVADTDEVRGFLREFIASTDDSGLFMSAGFALGKLRDTDSAVHFRDKLFREHWDGVERHLVASLGEMGGSTAGDILLGYLRDERAQHPSDGVEALARVDRQLAEAEADRLGITLR